MLTNTILVSWFSNAFNALSNMWGGQERSFFTMLNGSASYLNHTSQEEKLKLILTNPAALYIFILLPELFSMGKFQLVDNDGEKIDRPDDPLLKLLNKPNPLQTGSQFKWDYMFWRKLGTANLYIDSKMLSERNKMYFISGDKLEWSNFFKDNRDSLILSTSKEAQMKREIIKYKSSNQEFAFRYEQLLQFFDLSNGFGDWFKSPSRVDALYKIVSNSANALQAKNINAEFSAKYMVSGQTSVDDVSSLMMNQGEKQSIEQMVRSGKSVHAVRSQLNINRFVENAGVLTQLDEAYMNDAFLIGKMLNIPKDVIEMLGDSTYENQEKARASIVSYCIEPDAEDFCNGLTEYFGYDDKGVKLKLDFSHLPFVQVFESEKANVMKGKADALLKLVDAGADQQEAAEWLGIDVTVNNPRNERRTAQQAPEED